MAYFTPTGRCSEYKYLYGNGDQIDAGDVVFVPSQPDVQYVVVCGGGGGQDKDNPIVILEPVNDPGRRVQTTALAIQPVPPSPLVLEFSDSEESDERDCRRQDERDVFDLAVELERCVRIMRNQKNCQ